MTVLRTCAAVVLVSVIFSAGFWAGYYTAPRKQVTEYVAQICRPLPELSTGSWREPIRLRDTPARAIDAPKPVED